MKYSAILFDLDGTLMNTIKLYERAVIDTIRGYGATLTPRRFAEIYRSGDSISEWIREFGIDPEKNMRSAPGAISATWNCSEQASSGIRERNCC